MSTIHLPRKGLDMHESVVLRKLRNNETVWCAKANLTDPSAVEIMGYAGADFVWLCMEHGPIDVQAVHHQVRAAKMLGMDAMVRVAKGSYCDYIKPFEMDATGIMVPHVMSGQEAAEVVRTTRFQPVGRRAWDSGNSDGPFCMRTPKEYIRFAAEQKFVMVQIEDKESVECMEDIVATEGIDIVFLGPGDLSHSYGVPGEAGHPLVRQAVDKLAALCKKYNRFWGIPCSPETAPQVIEKGARFLAAGADVIAISDYFNRMREGFRAIGMNVSGRV